MTKSSGTLPLKVENVPIELLVPNVWNPNVVSPENELKIEESIKRFGFFRPILTRTLNDGRIEIIGGEHRVAAAKRMGHEKVPAINLGKMSDQKAREICVTDNGRYGADDSLRLAELLGDLEIGAAELAGFLPYSESDFNSIFSSVSITLDDLDIGEDDEKPMTVAERPVQSHQILRFKVPLGDASRITDLITRTMKTQRFKDGDELENAGDALVHLLNGGSGA